MRRRKTKKFIYRRSAPVIGICFIVILGSGFLLTIMEKTGSISFGMDEMNYISGAVAAQAYNKEEAEENNEGEDNIEDGEYRASENSYEEQEEDRIASENSATKSEDKEKGFLKMLLCTALSSGESDDPKTDNNGAVVTSDETGVKVVSSAVDESVNQAETVNQTETQENTEPVVSDIDGAVFIYHTHSTESYEPYSAGNYHVTGSQGTVRNVAENLRNALEAKGIKVYHDMTLHDNPSYNNSYGRSLKTANNYLSQYPDITLMIDLHRDAMASGGKKYNTIEVNGEQATSFNIVVGRQNNNYKELVKFANLVISKANELYPGLGGRVIERDYKFNEYLSNHYILAEVGNNGNTIQEAETTGKLMGDVIEAVMREMWK